MDSGGEDDIISVRGRGELWCRRRSPDSVSDYNFNSCYNLMPYDVPLSNIIILGRKVFSLMMLLSENSHSRILFRWKLSLERKFNHIYCQV